MFLLITGISLAVSFSVTVGKDAFQIVGESIVSVPAAIGIRDWRVSFKWALYVYGHMS